MIWEDMNCEFFGAVVTRAQAHGAPLELPMTALQLKDIDHEDHAEVQSTVAGPLSSQMENQKHQLQV